MTIAIHSRKSMERLFMRGFPSHTAVISFCDPPGSGTSPPINYAGRAERVFQIVLKDIRFEELEQYGLAYEEYFTEADELAEFIFAAIRDGLDIICQCENGDSRSAGCAAALHEFFTADGVFIFADYRYSPNQMVFHKVYNALWLSGRT